MNRVGVHSITEAIEERDIIVIDEIGPMELFSGEFKDATQKALDSDRVVIAVIHYKAGARLIASAKNRQDAEIFEATLENRENLHETITEKAVESLRLGAESFA